MPPRYVVAAPGKPSARGKSINRRSRLLMQHGAEVARWCERESCFMVFFLGEISTRPSGSHLSANPIGANRVARKPPLWLFGTNSGCQWQMTINARTAQISRSGSTELLSDYNNVQCDEKTKRSALLRFHLHAQHKQLAQISSSVTNEVILIAPSLKEAKSAATEH